MRRRQLIIGFSALALARPARSAAAGDFAAIERRARGSTVYFHAWGGSPEINRYIAWVADEVRARFGIELVHVRVGDTAEAVSTILVDAAAGRRDGGGSVDLVWINGENFAALKKRDLLYGPFAQTLPNFALVDVENRPTTVIDFTIPTEGFESPWGMAQFVFLYDSASVPVPPAGLRELVAWARAHSGRFTYPAPPDFVGTTFLKHLLHLVVPREALLVPPPAARRLSVLTQPFWELLDDLHPSLWRKGRAFPASHGQQHQLLADGELDFSMAFNPGEAANLILAGRLPDSIRTFVPREGSIANTHFVAIPRNASAKEGAMVVANFLLSPEAQARKLDPAVWGDGTVLAVDRLPPAARRLFDAVPRHPATLPPERLLPVLPEPHPDWVEATETAWKARYAS